ncbi:MAG: hypothetical protein C6I01_04565 [Epsilonproteobacteria bacterium]|nr:hypothetical protein [Campylobacterota bacterium]NPA89757.1 YqhA family protein [Campylobacterota bacterium]
MEQENSHQTPSTKHRGTVEASFEWSMWKSRLIVIFAVIFGIVGGILFSIVASFDVIKAVKGTFQYYFGETPHFSAEFHSWLIGKIIGAVDLYLIAVVLFIFSFGIYELFISRIDDAENSETGSRILAIHSLDELKDKLGKVVVMVLIVTFFKKVIHMDFNTPMDMFFLALSIFALALSLYFLHKGSH